MNESYISGLNTPIKKIRNLTIHSTRLSSPMRYPSMSDMPMGNDPISESMIEKGYSQTLSNAVLMELDTRAQEISSNVALSFAASRPKLGNQKRYSGIHRPLFSNMDSISSHYAASRQPETDSQDISSSASKKRRTLNGSEETFFGLQNDPSPTRRKTRLNLVPSTNAQILNGSLGQTPHKLQGGMFAGRIQPLTLNVHLTASSPEKRVLVSPTIPSSLLRSSPFKTPSISPSRGSMNLHGLLLDDSHFAKPKGPVRIRQTSLQMAGVKLSESGIPSRLKKASNNELGSSRVHANMQRKPSFESLRKVPPTRNTLEKKPFMSSLNHKPTMNNLQHKSSIPSLQKKPSIPTLRNVSKSSNSTASFHSGNVSSSTSLSSLQLAPPIKEEPALVSSLIPRFSASRSTSHNFTVPRNHLSMVAQQDVPSRSIKANVTVPKPFSLYNKPTISSSQKSFGSQNSLHSAISNGSLQASQRSLNRFQKFKSRFA